MLIFEYMIEALNLVRITPNGLCFLYTKLLLQHGMNFLQKILNRPDNERPYLLLPVGYEANEVYVPNIKRKSLDEMAVFYE